MDKMLFVAWNKRERTTYWVDKDAYSRAHQQGNIIVLEAYEGTYHFDLETKIVTLHNFKDTVVSVLEWCLFEEPFVCVEPRDFSQHDSKKNQGER